MITWYEVARVCYQSSKFLFCIVKFNFASWNAVLFYVTILYYERLLRSVKNCFVSRKIVVFREKLFCIAKDCCVPWRIVLYRERLLCTVKNCFVSRKIIVYPAQYWVVFCPCGPPYISLQRCNSNIFGLTDTVALFGKEARFFQILGCSSRQVVSKTKSVTPHCFYISDITNSSSFSDKLCRKKSMLEIFRANVVKCFVIYLNFSVKTIAAKHPGNNCRLVSRSGYIWIWSGVRDHESTNHSARFVEWKSRYMFVEFNKKNKSCSLALSAN